MKRIIFIVVFCCMIFCKNAYAYDEYTKIDGEDFFNDTVKTITQGEFSLVPENIFSYIIDKFSEEIVKTKGLIISVFIIALVSGVLNSANIENQTSESAFFVCYALMSIAVVKIITTVVGYGTDVIDEMSVFVTKLAPMMSILLVTSGYTFSASSFYPVFSASIYFICMIIQKCVVPMIYISCVTGILNNITSKIQLDNFNKLIKGLSKWILTGSLTIFTGINAIYGFCAPSVDGVAMKTAKFAVGSMVPVVGTFVADSIDTVISGTRLVKNSVGTAGIIVLIAMCVLPLLKVLAVMLMLKISSAVIEPISDKRYSDMLGEASESATSIFAMMITVAILFIISIAIIIGTTNKI